MPLLGRKGLLETQVATKPLSRRRTWAAAIVVAVSALIIVLALAVPPEAPLSKAWLVGYAICHQIPARSFFLAGQQLPLCARCTGTFLGAILGLTAMIVLGRGRASRLPALPVLGVLVLFMGLWAFDGLNSYLTFFPNAPHLYEPQNWLRLTTGTLSGLTMMTLVWPLWNLTVWRHTAAVPVLKNLWELAALLPFAALLIVVVQAQIGFLLYPLALLSTLGVLLLLILINSMAVAVALGREAYAQTWRQALAPMVVGAGLAVVQLAGLDLVRAFLTARYGLPF